MLNHDPDQAIAYKAAGAIGSQEQTGLLVVMCSRFYANEAGTWTTTSYNYELWSEYLDSWDHVTVAAPCLRQEPPAHASRADGPSVAFVSLGNTYGAVRRFLALPRRFALLREPVSTHDALILHAPDDLTGLAFSWARMYGKPYGLDVRGSQSLDAKYLRSRGIWGARVMAQVTSLVFRWQCAHATSAVYVSTKLRERFPLPDGRPVWVLSDIRLPEWWFTGHRDYTRHEGVWRICSVGRLDVEKGHSLLLEACAGLVRRIGPRFTLDLIGDGPLSDDLRERAAHLGISDLVTFHGFVPWGSSLHDHLLQADLFVLSSTTEGMPRVVLEAMACGLAVVSTRVGGVPEVLSPQDLVPCGDVSAMTAKLGEVLSDPGRMSEMSQRNCERIQTFRPDRLRAARQEFCAHLRGVSKADHGF